VSDIFQEVDEEVRREKLQQLWERHSNLIVAAALVVVLAVGGWRGYDWWENKKAAESGAAFEAALNLAESGKQDGGAGGLCQARAGRQLRLSRARPLPRGGRTRQDRPPPRRRPTMHSRTIRARPHAAGSRGRPRRLILVDTAPLAELTAKLEPLTAADRPFRHTARELLALRAWRTATAAAKRWFDLIATDAETPAGTRQRMDVLMTLSGDRAKT
jgi:hypothetical protein